MNFNANSSSRNPPGGGPKKLKRVSDLNAIGMPAPIPQYNRFDQTVTPLSTGYDPQNVAVNQYVPTTAYSQSVNLYDSYSNTPQQPLHSNVPMNSLNPGPPTGTNAGFPAQFSVFQQPIVQDMAMQYGQKLADQGKELVHTQFEKYIPVTKLKYYFSVDNKYVVNKLRLIFFPFTQSDWSLKYDHDNPVQPRYDINAPDLYIPTMAYITYVVLAGMVLGKYFTR